MKDIYVLRVEKLDQKKCRVEYVVPLTNTSENIVGCVVNSFDTNIENFDYFSKHLINPLFDLLIISCLKQKVNLQIKLHILHL